MATSNLFVAHPAPSRRLAPTRVLAVVASLLLASMFVLGNSRAAFTAQTATSGSWETAAVALRDDTGGSVTFSTDAALVPGDVVTGQVTVTYDGSAESVDVHLVADGLVDDAGLADVLEITVDDGHGTYTGTLSDLVASPGELAWSGVAPGQSRTYDLEVALDPAAGNEYAASTASVDLIWHAETNATQDQG